MFTLPLLPGPGRILTPARSWRLLRAPATMWRRARRCTLCWERCCPFRGFLDQEEANQSGVELNGAGHVSLQETSLAQAPARSRPLHGEEVATPSGVGLNGTRHASLQEAGVAQVESCLGESMDADSFVFPPNLFRGEEPRASTSVLPDGGSFQLAGVASAGSCRRASSSESRIAAPLAGELSQLASGMPLALAVDRLSRAAVFGDEGKVASLRRASFVDGLEALADALDNLDGSLGSHVKLNTAKLRRSKADGTEDDYRTWLLSELPVHVAAGARGYVDDSAWMANLWIGRILEFLAALFLFIAEPWRVGDGQSPQGSRDVSTLCVEAAYAQTLRPHHGFIQRAAFTSLLKHLPSRARFIQQLGSGFREEVTTPAEAGACRGAASCGTEPCVSGSAAATGAASSSASPAAAGSKGAGRSRDVGNERVGTDSAATSCEALPRSSSEARALAVIQQMLMFAKLGNAIAAHSSELNSDLDTLLKAHSKSSSLSPQRVRGRLQ